MDGKQQGIVLAETKNPLEKLQERFKELQTDFKTWVAKQPVVVEAAVVALTSGSNGAAIGAIMGTYTKSNSSTLPVPNPQAGPEVMASLKQAQALSGGPLAQARNFAVMSGVNGVVTCVLKRVRGVEDVQNCLAAGFCSGVAFSLVSGIGGPNQLGDAVTSGLFFALVQGGFYQFGQKISAPPSDDLYYARAKNMLKGLGLEQYTKNFKKGLLTDQTLHLLTDSALKDVRIPPGPRLVILDHIQRDPELTKRGKF